jgi:beta-glucosidase
MTLSKTFRTITVALTIYCSLLTVQSSGQAPVYKDATKPIEERVQDLISRMTLKEKVGQLNIPCCYDTQIGWGLHSNAPSLWSSSTRENRDKQIEGCRKWAEGTHNDVFGPGGGFFTLSDQLIHEGTRRQAETLNELQKIAIEKTRLGIPLLEIEEGTHGMMCAGGTVFPEGLAIGSTWNKDLVKKIYTAAIKEARSQGIHGLCTLVLELNIDPRMGRNEEGYGEDPYMVSMIAQNIVQAIQGYDISAPDKGFAVFTDFPGQNPTVSGLERGAVEVSDRKLYSELMPPWIAGIKKAGALGVMAGYPSVDGVASHGSERLFTKILREELGFKGIVLGEGGGLSTVITERQAANQKEAGIQTMKAGIDIGISIEDAYMKDLIDNVNEGKISMQLVDRSLARLLRLKFQLGLFEHPYIDVEKAVKTVHTDEHKELALQVARESMVLLKNEPFKRSAAATAAATPLLPL